MDGELRSWPGREGKLEPSAGAEGDSTLWAPPTFLSIRAASPPLSLLPSFPLSDILV